MPVERERIAALNAVGQNFSLEGASPPRNYDDVACLRARIFEAGLASRAEAEQLLAFDRGPAGTVPGWASFLIEAITDYVVWQSRPTGRVTESDLDWILGCLGDQPTHNGAAIAFNIIREAHEAPERLLEFALRTAQAHPKEF